VVLALVTVLVLELRLSRGVALRCLTSEPQELPKPFNTLLITSLTPLCYSLMKLDAMLSSVTTPSGSSS
jgi:hypothetical protein